MLGMFIMYACICTSICMYVIKNTDYINVICLSERKCRNHAKAKEELPRKLEICCGAYPMCPVSSGS